MKHNVIKYWSKKSLLTVTIINLIVMLFFIVFGAIFIKTLEDRLVNITLTVLINIIIMLMIYGFSIANTSYETVYQIKIDNQGYNTKLYRYLLILFGIGWLIFFILNAFFMFTFSIIHKTNLDYFAILSNKWWILLIVSFYHIFLIALHRQLLYYAIHHQKMPWEKNNKNNKKQN